MLQLPEFRCAQVIQPYENLRDLAVRDQDLAWLLPLLDQSDYLLSNAPHGDLPRWRAALGSMPTVEPFLDGSLPAPRLGRMSDDRDKLAECLMELHPWRKGPLNIGGVAIDTEWRSDWKWERIAAHLDLAGHRVLDIGCGNGYFGWRMLAAGARWVIGIDPTLVFVMQWLACRRFAGEQPNVVLPLGLEDLPPAAGGFDTVFSMGVLYHRKDPVRHLQRLGRLVKPRGRVVLETLVLEGNDNRVLVPEGRYARMRNVWAIPTLSRLNDWIRDAGLQQIAVMDLSATTTEEQRSTGWMHFESLAESLDSSRPELTVEGHPAPLRCAILCMAE